MVYWPSHRLTTEGVTHAGDWSGGDLRDQSYANVPAHIVALTGQITPYDAEPVDYCAGGDGSTSGEYVRMVAYGPYNGFSVHPTQRLDSSGGAVHPTLSEGATPSCAWYNVQA